MKHIIPTICPDSGSVAPVVAAPLWDALFWRDVGRDVWDAWSRDDSSPANHPGPRCPTVLDPGNSKGRSVGNS